MASKSKHKKGHELKQASTKRVMSSKKQAQNAEASTASTKSRQAHFLCLNRAYNSQLALLKTSTARMNIYNQEGKQRERGGERRVMCVRWRSEELLKRREKEEARQEGLNNTINTMI